MKIKLHELQELGEIARRHDVDVAALIAVVKVESAGQVFADVSGMQVPLIRWEGHYFYKFLKGEARNKAVAQGLANPKAGAVKNPKSQAERYAMLDRAAKIDRVAAYSSISIGAGQVMGSHWKDLGFNSPVDMLKLAVKGMSGQVELMMRFIVKNGLLDELRRRDWSAFARAYNGPAYKKNAYDTNMAKAYQWALKMLASDPTGAAPKALPAPSAPPTAGMLRMGSSGAGVRELQRLLGRAGYAVKVDGDFGPTTKKAVMAFQKAQGLEVDGVVGPATNSRIMKFKEQSENLGDEAVLELSETKSAAAGAGGGIGLVVIADKLNEVADKMVGSEMVETVASGLYAAAGLVIVGALLWGAYGYIKSRRTYEGVA